LIELFDQDGLKRKIIAYVKDEGSNSNVMIIALISIVRCEVLGLDESFQDSICFGHAFFYDLLVCYKWWKGLQNLKFVSIKST